MANDLSNIMPKILARGLLTLRELAIMPRLVNADYSLEGAQKGQTIDVPVPTAVGVTDVAPSNVPPSPTDTTPALVQIPLNNWKQNNPFYLTDKQLVEVDANRHFIPMQVQEAVRALANEVNLSIHNEYKGVYGLVGTAGTTPFSGAPGTVAAAVNARKLLHQQLAPRGDRRFVMDFDAEASALSLPEFNDVSASDDRDVKIEGEVGRKFGFDFFADDQVVTHVAGNAGGTADLRADAFTAEPTKRETTTMTFDNAVASDRSLAKGDVFTIAGDTQQYVVTEAATIGASATNVVVKFAPGLKVTTFGGEVVTVVNDHVVNLAFHRDAFGFATRPLADAVNGFPGSENIAVLQDPVTGLILRLEVSRQHKQVAWEFDILWGVKLVRPELAVRVAG